MTKLLASIALAAVLATSLACGLTDSPPPPAPAPSAAPAPASDGAGFGALFERPEPQRHAPGADTAEPPAAAPAPAAAVGAAPRPAPAAAPPAEAAPSPSPTAPGVTAAPSPSPTPPRAGVSTAAAPAPAPAPEATSGYRAIVAFYSGAEPESFSSEVASLRSAASAHGIQVVLAPVGSDRVGVDGGSVDISAFRAARDAGFVFAAQGRGSVFAYYPPQTPIRRAASGYFGVDL